MPVATPLDIAVLSSPVPVPGETGTIQGTSRTLDTQQTTNFGDVSNALTQGSGVVPAYGSGNRAQVIEENNPPPPPTPSSSGTFEASDLDETGSNVGGLAKEAGAAEDTKMELEYATASGQKEAEDAEKVAEEFENQVNEYQEAFDSGIVSETDTRKESAATGAAIGAKIGSAVPGAGTVIGAGLGAGIGFLAGKKKGERSKSGMSGVRFAKRQDRRADRDARKEAGLKGKEKRLARRAQRKQRRDAFKEFKDNLKLQAEVNAANFET